MSKEKPPNFLVIMTDQQRWDHLGCYGNTVVRTPRIDALARGGLRVDGFHVSNPICQPNRACLATGQLSTVNGCRQNGIPLAREAVTYAEVLRAAGWRTGLVGKAHFQNVSTVPAPPRRPAGQGDDPPEAVRSAWRAQRDGADYAHELRTTWRRDADHALPLPYYGFEHVQLCIGHGDAVEGHYTGWVRARHPDPDSLCGPANALPDPRGPVPQCWRTALPESLYPTTFIAEQACAFLDDRCAGDPFLLVLSFPDPHHPFTPPGRYADMYDPAEVILPASFARPLGARNDLPAALRRAYDMGDADPNSFWPWHADEAAIRRILALNYGAISFVDDAVGQVLDRLAGHGLDGETVVVFMSDHGDYMGDHGTVLKHGVHSRGLIRVPLLWADPQGPRGETAIHASAIDFAPTLLQRAGIKVPVGMQGRDVLAPDAADLPVLIEDPGMGVYADPEAMTAVRTLVFGGWRMSVFEGSPLGELYDLTADPHELVNLWAAPEAQGRRADMMQAMVQRQIALRDRSLSPTNQA
jgi:arylsulfatase A-like enzyme